MGQDELRKIINVYRNYVKKSELKEQYINVYGLSESSFERALQKLMANEEVSRIKPVNKNYFYYRRA